MPDEPMESNLYTHVIVPSDGTARSGDAQRLGADLAASFGAQLVVCTSADVRGTAALDQLKGAAQRRSTEHIYVRLDPYSDPVDAITAAADLRPSSIVVMATHAPTGADLILRGSVAEAVLLQIAVPVMMVGPSCAVSDVSDLRRLVVCVDGSDRSPVAVAVAATWAGSIGLGCTLLHISKGGPFKGMDDLAAELGRSGADVDIISVAGPDPVDGILEFLSRHGTAIPVLASHGRHGLRRVRHGSVVTDVVRRSPVPVLVVPAVTAAPSDREPRTDPEPPD